MSHVRPVRRWASALLFLVAWGLMLFPGPAVPHDIPDEILIPAFVKPEGQRLHFLVRVPLIMLANMNLPKRGPGYLDLARIDSDLEIAATIVARELVLYENGVPLSPARVSTRVSQPSERAFNTFDEAIAHIQGPKLPDATNVFWNQGYFDAYLEYRIQSDDSDFSVDVRVAPGLSGRLKAILRFITPEGSIRAYQVHGGSGLLLLDPGWYQAGWTFVKFGFSHILDGVDHLLFLLCLIAPFRLRYFWTLAGVITAFTVGHSITLIAAAFGAVPESEWFPPLVEFLIALSILFMAVENTIVMVRNKGRLADLRWRWLIAGAFGLVHGFGFSFALREDLQFAGSHFLLSLVSFNIGVELGQLLFLAVILPALVLVLRDGVARRIGIVILSILVAHTAWHWMVDRIEPLRFATRSALDINTLISLGLWALGLVLVTGTVWLLARQFLRRHPVQGPNYLRVPEGWSLLRGIEKLRGNGKEKRPL